MEKKDKVCWAAKVCIIGYILAFHESFFDVAFFLTKDFNFPLTKFYKRQHVKFYICLSEKNTTNFDHVDFLRQTIKKIIHQAGYTMTRGNLRQQVKNNASHLEIPQHLLLNARVCTNRYEVLKALPTGGTAVEVGVAYGDFSIPILNTMQPDLFIAIDSFGIKAGDEPWGRHTLQETGLSHYEYYTRQFSEKIQSGQMVVKKGLSWEVLAQLPDHSIDYIYLDADHSYESVSKEIASLKSKVKPQALLHFNDYTYFDQNALMPYGVPRAVHELMVQEQYEMLYLCLHPQGFYDVVLRKVLS